MTARTRIPPAGGLQAGTEPLFYARAVLADLAHYDDDTIRFACRFVIRHPDTDDTEKADAEETLARIGPAPDDTAMPAFLMAAT